MGADRLTDLELLVGDLASPVTDPALQDDHGSSSTSLDDSI
jgi:hypothetical protein